LKENGVLLLYISADGYKPLSTSQNEASLGQNPLRETTTTSTSTTTQIQPYSLGGVRLNKGKKGESESKVSTPVSHRFDPRNPSTSSSTSLTTNTNSNNTNENPLSSLSLAGNAF
jgi:hypothetical protein